jgi:hypothetical protein
VKFVRFIAHIGVMRNAWIVLVGKLAEMRPLKHLDVDMNIKWIIEKNRTASVV